MAMSLLAFGFCKAYRFYVKSQREAMLQPPYDLSGGNIYSCYMVSRVFLSKIHFFNLIL